MSFWVKANHMVLKYLKTVPVATFMIAGSNVALSSTDPRQYTILQERPLYYSKKLAAKSLAYGLVWPAFIFHSLHPRYQLRALMTDFD